MSHLSAQPGRGRICKVTFGTGGRSTVVPATLVPHLRQAEPWSDDDSVVRAVPRVDVVIPHTGRDYATGAVLTVTAAPVARALAEAFTRAAELLEQEIPQGALGTLEATPEPVEVPQPV